MQSKARYGFIIPSHPVTDICANIYLVGQTEGLKQETMGYI